MYQSCSGMGATGLSLFGLLQQCPMASSEVSTRGYSLDPSLLVEAEDGHVFLQSHGKELEAISRVTLQK